MRNCLLALLLSACSLLSVAQVSVEDSTIAIPMIYGSFAQQLPGGVLKERFGTNSSIGAGFMHKTQKNWMFGFDYNFLFGSDVKDPNIFGGIATQPSPFYNQDGEIVGYGTNLIDIYGGLAEIRLYQRGHHVSAKFGKLFPVLGPNPNSGIFFLAGIGFLQHHIRIENPGNITPQLNGDYKLGYERLTNGLATSQFLGYLFMSNNRLLNFFGGVEFVQGFTQERRYNFATMQKDETPRLDLLSGIKLGWIFPLYKKMPQKYYYY
jgi:hypothetical protein